MMKRMTPALQRSTALRYPLVPAVNSTSGARYDGVPHNVCIKEFSPTNLERPKSVTLIRVSSSSLAKRMFSGCTRTHGESDVSRWVGEREEGGRGEGGGG